MQNVFCPIPTQLQLKFSWGDMIIGLHNFAPGPPPPNGNF